MVDINLTMPVIAININGLIHPLKDKACQNGSKNKPQLLIYQNPTLHINSHID